MWLECFLLAWNSYLGHYLSLVSWHCVWRLLDGDVVAIGETDNVAAISLDPVDRFPRFLVRFVGLIKTILSTSWLPETIRSFPRHCCDCFWWPSDLPWMHSATFPPDYGLNWKLLTTPFHRAYLRIAASARFWDIPFFFIMILPCTLHPFPFQFCAHSWVLSFFPSIWISFLATIWFWFHWWRVNPYFSSLRGARLFFLSSCFIIILLDSDFALLDITSFKEVCWKLGICNVCDVYISCSWHIVHL